MSKINPEFLHAEAKRTGTGKSFSEALIFASTNPQYDDRLFIELQLQYSAILSYLVTNLDLVTILLKTVFSVHKNILFSDNLVFSSPSI